jgi:hypothetical protein
MLLVAGIVLLILKQVMPIAARLAGGMALSSFGAASAVLGRGAGAIGAVGTLTRNVAAAAAARGLLPGAGGAPLLAGQAALPARVTPVWRAVRGGS